MVISIRGSNLRTPRLLKLSPSLYSSFVEAFVAKYYTALLFYYIPVRSPQTVCFLRETLSTFRYSLLSGLKAFSRLYDIFNEVLM